MELAPAAGLEIRLPEMNPRSRASEPVGQLRANCSGSLSITPPWASSAPLQLKDRRLSDRSSASPCAESLRPTFELSIPCQRRTAGSIRGRRVTLLSTTVLQLRAKVRLDQANG